jgi:conjugal transfer pilus assembly protein TrbC
VRPFIRRSEALFAPPAAPAVRAAFTVLAMSAVAALLAHPAARAQGQTLFESMRGTNAAAPAGGYVFVSEKLSDTALIPLARDARRAGFTLVLNGFWGDLAATRQRVASLNDACCGKDGPHWQINPLLFQRYKVAAVPSFVIVVGPGEDARDYSKVSGEMSMANALKFFGQQSALPTVRRLAANAYTKAFASP